jgi:WD40 repeat protein
MDGILVMWDLETFTPLYHLGSARVKDDWGWTQLAVSSDGRWVGTMLPDGKIGLWDARTGTEIMQLPTWGSFGVAFSPDSRYLMTSETPEMRLWDLASGAEMQRFDTERTIFGIALSPDGTTLFVSTANRMMSEDRRCVFLVFDVATGQTLRQIEIGDNATDEIGCILWASPAFSPDGRTVLTGVDERVIVWDVQTGSRLKTFSSHSASISAVAVSPDGRTVLSGDVKGVIILWDMDSTQEIRRLATSGGQVEDIQFTQDGRAALTAGSSPAALLWNLATGEIIRRFEDTKGTATSLRLSPDGSTVLTCDDSGQITEWDYATGQIMRSLLLR